MICFITFDGTGYKLLDMAFDDCDAPSICLALEQNKEDYYCVYASRDGQIVADAEGWIDENPGSPPYDAVTATGMYDLYDC